MTGRTAPASRSALDVRPVSDAPDEVREICALFRETMPRGPTWREDYFRWLYFANPVGPIVGFNAWDGRRLAAHYVVLPLRAAYNGTPVAAALSLNTATRRAYQRRGLFVRLAEATYEVASRSGVHHVIGIANANSTHGLVRSLGFCHLGPLDAVINLGLPRLGGTPDPAHVGWRRIWQDADLAWRLRNPASTYRLQRSGDAVAVLAPTGVAGLKAVMHFADDPSRAALIHDLLRPTHVVGPRLRIGLSRRIHDRTLSVDVPGRFRRSPLNMVFLPLQGADVTLDREAVEFDALDFDAF